MLDYLKEQIESGRIQPGQQVPSEQTLAEMFGVSRITSKRALVELEQEGLIYRIQGKGSFVQEPKRSNNSSINVIALVLPFDTSQGGIMGAIMGATEHLGRLGYYLSVHSTGSSAKKEREIISELVIDNVAGIIFYPASDKTNLDLLYRLYLEKYPIVLIDKYIDNVPISCVLVDHFRGGYMACEHLIKNGHTRIAFVATSALGDVMSVRQRAFGYLQALFDHGISIDSRLVRENNVPSLSSLHPLVQELVEQGVTAIQAENDVVAYQLLEACSAEGLSVPGDISIVGFDNLDYSFGPDLTTIEQDFHQLGVKTAELIVEAVEDGVQFREELLPVTFVEGTTTKSVTANGHPQAQTAKKSVGV